MIKSITMKDVATYDNQAMYGEKVVCVDRHLKLFF